MGNSNDVNAKIAFSYITGNVTSNSGNVGLFAGSNNTTIKSSYATGSLTKNGTIINGFSTLQQVIQ